MKIPLLQKTAVRNRIKKWEIINRKYKTNNKEYGLWSVDNLKLKKLNLKSIESKEIKLVFNQTGYVPYIYLESYDIIQGFTQNREDIFYQAIQMIRKNQDTTNLKINVNAKRKLIFIKE